MVGIVLVSHSPTLAAGLRELLTQLTGERVVVALAAGTSDGRLGTDATRIADAIREADSGDGVAVLMDLGSAVLSAATALDLLGEEAPSGVVLCDAPFVEGAVAAAVAASIGGSAEAVRKAAEEARSLPKLVT